MYRLYFSSHFMYFSSPCLIISQRLYYNPNYEWFQPFPHFLETGEYESSLLASCHNDFIYGLCDIALFQINPIRNTHGRSLDLIFYNKTYDVIITRASPLSLLGDLASNTFGFCVYRCSKYIYTHTYVHRKTDYNALRNHLAEIGWNFVQLLNLLMQLRILFML